MADVSSILQDESVQARFWSRVDKSGDCWIWTGAVNPDGYGGFRVKLHPKPRTLGAHRVALEFSGVEIPQGMCVLHSCDNPSCVRPDHLRVGTHAENMADMRAKGRNKMSGAHLRALSYEQAQAIRFEYTGRRGEQSVLGRKYGVSVGIIWNIVNNKAYRRPFEASTMETPHEGQ